MKKLLFSLIIFLTSTILFAETRVVFSQDFENAVVGTDLLGNVQVHNFNSGGGASWSYDLATGGQAISGNKSAHLNIQSAGDQWWGLQFKVEDPALSSVGKGLKYKITFKIKSSTNNNNFQFRIEGTGAYGENINIPTANVVQEVSLESTLQEGTGTANFLWTFGAASNPGDIWIDDIVVTELYTPLNFSENFNNVLPTATNIGDFSLGNYEGGAWTFGVEQVGTDSSNKCAWLNITENSFDWWIMQFKVEKFPVIKDKQYVISFKAKSTLPNSFNFRVEGTSDFMTIVNTQGTNEFETFSYETPPMQRSGVANFLWAFGRPTLCDKFYIDDITIQEKSISTVTHFQNSDAKFRITLENNILYFLDEIHAQVFVYDVTGKKIIDRRLDGNSTSLVLSNNQGIMIVKCLNDNGVVLTKKIISFE